MIKLQKLKQLTKWVLIGLIIICIVGIVIESVFLLMTRTAPARPYPLFIAAMVFWITIFLIAFLLLSKKGSHPIHF